VTTPKVNTAAKHLKAALRELEVTAGEEPALMGGLSDDMFEEPNDGRLRFRDLAIGEDFHFMGSWPGVDHQVPGYRKYTKITGRKFTHKDGDRVSVHHVRADLMEVARAETVAASPETQPATE
jgi:hypothetical protein